MKKTPEKTPLYARVFALLLMAALAAGFVLFVLSPDARFSPEENRVLQQAPAFSWQRLASGKYTRDVETYIADQFPGRTAFVALKSLLARATLQRENNGVYFGDDGNLYEQLAPMDASALDRNAQVLAKLKADTGLPVCVLPVPSASFIRQEHLPANAPLGDQRAMMAALCAQLAGSGVEVVDVFDDFAAANADAVLYFGTDHHWNARGAYMGYAALARALDIAPNAAESYQYHVVSETFRGTLSSKSGDFYHAPDALVRITRPGAPDARLYVVDDDTRYPSLYLEEKLQEKDQYTYYLGGNHAVTVTEAPSGSGRRLMLLKDSYAHILTPYLAEHFDEIHLIDTRYYNGDLKAYAAEHGITDIAALYTMKNLNETRAFGAQG
nr:DHHW family protein [Maliibacterium massiliense]